jgi:hypothetical protein
MLSVFQTATQRRASHAFSFAPSMRIWIPTTLSPFADPTTWMTPVA